MLLRELKSIHTLQNITMFVEDSELCDKTEDLVAMLPHWPALRKVTLVGFVWDADMTAELTWLAMSENRSLSDFIISGGGGSASTSQCPNSKNSFGETPQ